MSLRIVTGVDPNQIHDYHCVKSVRIRSYSGPYYSAFGLNTERYSVYLHIQSECGKVRTRITPNTDTFYVVFYEKIAVSTQALNTMTKLKNINVLSKIISDKLSRIRADLVSRENN